VGRNNILDAVKNRWFWVALAAALLVRIPAITSLPVDWDEPIYMDAALAMSDGVRVGDWTAVLDPALNREHPGLVKCLYGLGFLGLGPDPDLVERLSVVRGLSLIAGLGMVVLAVQIHPAAGIAVAIHTLHAKYTCEGYLDAWPALWMAMAMIVGWRRRTSFTPRDLVLVGLCWGAAIAGKWIHGLPGVVLLFVISGWRSRVGLIAVALLSAWMLDPTMWLDPIDRSIQMVQFHQSYSATVPDSGALTPWITLAGGGPAVWHPKIFPVSVDGALLVFGLLGLGAGIRSSWGRFLAAWFVIPMAVLMIWGTRWPQHLMVLLMPLCMAVAAVIRPLSNRANRRFSPSD
jgi:hypothetical protein